MLGLQIDQNKHFSVYGSLSALLALAALVLAIFVGPAASCGASVIGFGLALAAFLKMRGAQFPMILMGVHAILCVAAGVLYFLFLRPLDKNVQTIPSLQYLYTDPDHFFSVRGPQGWSYENVASSTEAGVRLRPVEQGQYMGVSEVLIIIRKMEARPKSSEDYLNKMAHQLTEKKDAKSKTFNLVIEPAHLLTGQKGLWSILDAKRYWVPVRQVSLMGIKNNLYLCSVSAIGLKNHSTLSKVLCLGLFETIKIKTGEK